MIQHAKREGKDNLQVWRIIFCLQEVFYGKPLIFIFYEFIFQFHVEWPSCCSKTFGKLMKIGKEKAELSSEIINVDNALCNVHELT